MTILVVEDTVNGGTPEATVEMKAVALIFPDTSNFVDGVRVPIPILLLLFIRITSIPPSINPIWSASGKYIPVFVSLNAAIEAVTVEPVPTYKIVAFKVLEVKTFELIFELVKIELFIKLEVKIFELIFELVKIEVFIKLEVKIFELILDEVKIVVFKVLEVKASTIILLVEKPPPASLKTKVFGVLLLVPFVPIVIKSIVALLVIIIPFPALIVKVSLELSALTVSAPGIDIIPNAVAAVPPAEEFIVKVLVALSVLNVILVPAATVNIELVDAATRLFWPDTDIVANAFPPALLSTYCLVAASKLEVGSADKVSFLFIMVSILKVAVPNAPAVVLPITISVIEPLRPLVPISIVCFKFALTVPTAILTVYELVERPITIVDDCVGPPIRIEPVVIPVPMFILALLTAVPIFAVLSAAPFNDKDAFAVSVLLNVEAPSVVIPL